MKSNQNDISIRRANIEDFESIYDLICQLENCIFYKKIILEVYSDNLNNRNIRYFVAVKNDKIVGFVSLYINLLLHHGEKVGEIQELVVDKELRNSGIGKILIRKIEEIAIKEEIHLLEVSCNRKRIKAHGFYENLGFLKSHYKFAKTI
jgi:(aminoalkyl)phosphonate N-acetyltransferase